MFRNLFRPDSALMLTMTQLTDCIFLSLFWIAGCFPLVTVGASTAALYDASFRAFRRGEKHGWQRFWQVFRQNWRGCVVPGLLFLLGLYGIWRLVIGCWNAAVYGQISWMLFSAGVFLGVFLLGILSVLFPMVSRFDNGLGQLLKNTLFLSMANLPRTLVLGLLNGLSAVVCLRWIYPLFFLPSLAALLGSFLLEPMFRPYQPQEHV